MKRKSQRPLLARRDVEMEIEHEVKSSDREQGLFILHSF